MPQASSELRERWGGAMGVGEDKAVVFLKRRGWHLSRVWLWYRDDARDPTPIERDAMQFLIDEWDYGGVR